MDGEWVMVVAELGWAGLVGGVLICGTMLVTWGWWWEGNGMDD